MANKVGERIKSRLNELHMNQSDLCRKTGINRATMSQYISGKYFPTQKRLEEIAQALHVSPAYLMGWAEEDVATKKPLYEAAAGEGRTTDWYATEEISIKHESDTSAVRVIGNSMHPTIQDNDVVIVQAQSIIDYPRQIALVKIDGEDATLKRVEVKDDGLMLIADNIDVYSPHFYTAKEVETLPVKIEGVVVQLIRNMR